MVHAAAPHRCRRQCDPCTGRLFGHIYICTPELRVFPGSDLPYALRDGGASCRVPSSHSLSGGAKAASAIAGVDSKDLLLRQGLPEK